MLIGSKNVVTFFFLFDLSDAKTIKHFYNTTWKIFQDSIFLLFCLMKIAKYVF